jgi:hypothetical protein
VQANELPIALLRGHVELMCLRVEPAHEILHERYDADFLFNKAATLLFVIAKGEPVVEQIEAEMPSAGGGKLSPKYLESLRAELLFTALHQCETFFALLIALYQPLPHWVYLTTYETKEIKQAVEQILAHQIRKLTAGAVAKIRDFVKLSVYGDFVMAADPERASRWDENLDNAAWLIERIGGFYLEYDGAYNSYKHGLRVMTGPHWLGIAPENPDGTVQGPMRIIQLSEDALTYLQKEPVREVDGAKEIPISESTRAFNPFEASFYLAKMNQMLQTIKATRLAVLRGDGVIPSINTYFGMDRDYVLQLATRGEWTTGPMRADQARAFDQWLAQRRTNAEQPDQTEQSTDTDGSST